MNNPDLYIAYFNNNAQSGRISKTFNGIASYRSEGQFSITEFCDPNGSDAGCRSQANTVAYHQPGRSDNPVVFCQAWFGLPAILGCDYPSPQKPAMIDQGGTFLHELTHVQLLAGVGDIADGNGCYDWYGTPPTAPYITAFTS